MFFSRWTCTGPQQRSISRRISERVAAIFPSASTCTFWRFARTLGRRTHFGLDGSAARAVSGRNACLFRGGLSLDLIPILSHRSKLEESPVILQIPCPRGSTRATRNTMDCGTGKRPPPPSSLLRTRKYPPTLFQFLSLQLLNLIGFNR